MSTEQKKDEFDYDAFAAKVQEKVSADINSLKGKVEETTTKLASQIESLSAKGGGDGLDDAEDLDDDAVLTKKDVLKLMKENQSTGSTDINKAVNEAITEVTKRQSRDAQTFQEFPMLNSTHPTYNKGFVDEVQAEMKTRAQDRKIDPGSDPYLLSDAAAAVFSRNPKYQALQRSAVEEDQRRFNNRHGSFNVNRNTSNSTEPTQEQLRVASKLGLSEESLRKHLKKSI